MRAKLFWNWFAKKYSQSPIENMQGYEHTLTEVKKHLNKKQVVFEFGCGTGTTALKLAKYVKHIDATDIAENMVAIGRNKAKEQKITNIDFKAMTLDDESLKEHSYDVVMGYNILHLSNNLDAAIARVNNLLKPGGLFIAKTPCIGGNVGLKIMTLFFGLLMGSIKCFTVEELRDSLKRNQFEIIKEHVYQEKAPRALTIAKKRK